MLDIQSLAARRGGRKVFRDITFTLNAGEALVVRGANGSGKSSLLRTLAGLIDKTDGKILWQGVEINPRAAEHRARQCYISHLDALKPELTVAETLDYWRALGGGIGNQESGVLDIFQISGLANKAVRTLSAGQKRRLGLTRLLLSDAPLWLMDEPATALDKDGQKLLDGVIVQHRAKGGIAVIVTHHDDVTPDAKNLMMGA